MKEKQRKPNPYLTANCFSKITFWWLLDIFCLGKNNNLQEETLYDVLPENNSEFLGNQLEKFWKNEIRQAQTSGREPSLWKAIGKTYMWTIVEIAIFSIISNTCLILQPMILAKLILYFNPMSNMKLEEAYTYGSTLFIMIILTLVILRHQIHTQMIFGMRLRIACSSLLYRKVLRLSCASSGATVNGLIINIMSNDLAKLEKLCMYFHCFWILPLYLMLTSYFMWTQLGLAAIAGIIFMMMQIIPCQVLGYILASKLRIKSSASTDKRVRLIGEVINGIRVIKMYAWEKYFEQLVHLARQHEIDRLLKLAYIRGVNWATAAYTDRSALFCTIAVYVCLGNVISADKIFSTVHYFVLIRRVATELVPEAVFLTSASNIAQERIKEFLIRPEIESQVSTKNMNNKNVIVLKQVDAGWISAPNTNNICNMNLRVVAEKLYAVIGPVGSGKSSLLKLILGELPAKSGQVSVHGKVSFASQEPWLFTGSVKENILFAEEYDGERYNKVVDVCQLSEDFEQLPFGDRTLVGERGMSLSGGQCARINLARAVYRDADVYLFDDPLSAVDSHVSRRLFEECINGFLKTKTRILVTHQVQYLQQTDAIIVLDNGQIEFEGCYQSLIAHKKYLEHLSMSNDEQQQEIEVKNKKNLDSIVASDEVTIPKDTAPEVTKESVVQGQNSIVLLLKYFKAGGSYFKFVSIVFLFLITQLTISSYEYWLSYWSNQQDKRLESVFDASVTNFTTLSLPASLLSTETALSVSGGLVVAIVVLSNLKNFWFFKRCFSSSRAIHSNMFSRLLRTPMQFFNVNPSGRMLNRFSKDTGTVDDDLPNAMLEVMERALATSCVFIQIIVINWWTVGPMLIVGYICYKMNRIFLATTKNLKRLEGNAKSPVFSLVNSTLLGLATIRSNHAQIMISRNFDERQNAHTSAQNLCYVTTIAYSVWLDLLSSSFLGFMIYTFIPLKSAGIMGGDVGLALTQFLSVSSVLQLAMRRFAELVSYITALERMFEYTKLEQEGPFETEFDKKHDTIWPSRGEIKFENLNLRYSDEEGPVLKNLNFIIKPNMKVGVVGRTGAGKSSLIAALFRLAKFDGSIFIDNANTKEIGLLNLRSKISIIPQEPIFFTASLRDNLDPLEKFDDASLWSALRDVEMHKVFESLDQPIDGNLSAGQRQLFCLARAIVRKSKILMLDEATANVDLITDELIQRTIKSKFRDCTVLTIAHRLNTIMNSDIILVMDAGQVIEFDEPRNLLQKNDSYFSRIVEESGNAVNLRKIVDEAYRVSSNGQTAEFPSANNERDEITRL